MTADDFIAAASISRDMLGLEIGPSFNGRFRKADGWNVEIADHAPANELRAKYASIDGVDVQNIEEVDYIWQGGDLSNLISHTNYYDFIFASHVIEHMLDPIGFMQSCEKLLKPSGKLILIVPDKRHCFDFLRPISTFGNLIESHQTNSRKHRSGAVFDHYAYTGDLGGHAIWEAGWGHSHKLSPSFSVNDVTEAYEIFRKTLSESEYCDVHAWNFVPSSFRLIMKDLNSVGMIGLREAGFAPTHRCEFYFSASSIASGCPLSRIDIVRDIAREQIQGLSEIIATQ